MKTSVNGVELEELPPNLQQAMNKQLKMLLFTTGVMYIVSLFIMVFYVYLFKHTQCDLENEIVPTWFFPLSEQYVSQLDIANVPREKSCFLVTVLSAGTAFWCLALVFQLFWSLQQKISVSIPKLLAILTGCWLLIVSILYNGGIAQFKTLIFPSVDKPVLYNCVLLLSILASIFMIKMWVIDQIVAYVRYRLNATS